MNKLVSSKESKGWKPHESFCLNNQCRISSPLVVCIIMLAMSVSSFAQQVVPSQAIVTFENIYGVGSFGSRYIPFSADSARVRSGWTEFGSMIEDILTTVKAIDTIDLNGDSLPDISMTLLDLGSKSLRCYTVILCQKENLTYEFCSMPMGSNLSFLPVFLSKGADGTIVRRYHHEDPETLTRFYKADTISRQLHYWIKKPILPLSNALLKLQYSVTSIDAPNPSYIFTFEKGRRPQLIRYSNAKNYSGYPLVKSADEHSELFVLQQDSGYTDKIWKILGSLNYHDLVNTNSGGADRRQANLTFYFMDGTSKTIVDYGMDSNLTLMAFYDLTNKLPKTQWRKLDANKADHGTSGNH